MNLNEGEIFIIAGILNFNTSQIWLTSLFTPKKYICKQSSISNINVSIPSVLIKSILKLYNLLMTSPHPNLHFNIKKLTSVQGFWIFFATWTLKAEKYFHVPLKCH